MSGWMIHLVALMMIYGVVIHSSGAYVASPDYQIVSLMPSNDLLTDALKKDGYVVGFSSPSGNAKPFLIIEFKNISGNSFLECYVKKTFRNNPVELQFYISKDLKNWNLLKTDVAYEGRHILIIPGEYKKLYIKIVVAKSLKEGVGTSYIDYVGISHGLSIQDKIDIKSMYMWLGGVWIPLTCLVILFLSGLIGVSVVIDNTKVSSIFGILSFLIPFFLDLFLNINTYLFTYINRSIFSLTLSSFLMGVIFGISYIIYKRSKNSKA